MKLNYKNIMQEINEEATEGIITMNDTIQILRDQKPVYADYCPIIDWYYDKFTMEEELGTPIEEMYLPEEFSKEEWEEVIAGQAAYKKQYEEDQDKLVEIKVKDALTEMKQMRKLLQ